jgi:hypothetical protein
MSFVNKFAVFFFFLNACNALHNCSVLHERYDNYGCMLTNLTPEDEINEINMLATAANFILQKMK